MKAYILWSLRQFYLLLFLPTQFEREIESRTPGQPKMPPMQRLDFILKMLPWILALLIFSQIITTDYASKELTVPLTLRELLQWSPTAVILLTIGAGITFGVAVGVATGVVLSLVPTVAYAIWANIGKRIASIVGPEVLWELWKDPWENISTGIAFGIVVGLGANMAVGMRARMAIGAALCILLGVYSVDIATGTRHIVAPFLTETRVVLLALPFLLTFLLMYFRLATYPIDVGLTAAAYFVAKRRSYWVEQAWRWCPITWNEVIWFPLPFASKLLVLFARHNREEGFQRIAFVATERKLQLHAAAVALSEVAINDLSVRSVPEMPNAMRKLEWPTELLVVLPNEVATSMPTFELIAQHVDQYLTLQSTTRKGEALSRALAWAKTLEDNLKAENAKSPSRLLQLANDWRRLLEDEHKTIHQKVAIPTKRETLNPFVFGNPVPETEHKIFTGRQDIVKQIEASVLGATRAPTLLLHGARRMGKTSILNQLPRLLGPNFAPTLVDCQNPAVTGSQATLLQYLSRAIAGGLQRRRVTVELLTIAALDREPLAVFDRWLEDIERKMSDVMCILICLDEYERLQSALEAGWGEGFLDYLRHIMQHRSRLALLFTGSHTFAELGPAWTDRLISARRLRVSFLTPSETRFLLIRPNPEFDMTYEKGAPEAIHYATNGQPFLTQAVAFELVQYLNEHRRKEALIEDVEVAIARALVSGGEYFANLWNEAGAEGQAILSALAKGEAPPDSPTAFGLLREQDVLNDDGKIAVPMVERWVRDNVGR